MRCRTTALTGTRARPLPSTCGSQVLRAAIVASCGMADGDRAAMLPGHLLGSGELFGDCGGGLIVVEKHVASGVRNTVGDREPDARAGRGGP